MFIAIIVLFLFWLVKLLFVSSNRYVGGRTKDVTTGIKELNAAIESNNGKEFFFFNQLPTHLEYAQMPKLFRKNCHIGQRKLLMNEIQFLSAFTGIEQKDELVMYIGSAPCEHLTYIRTIFPGKKYLLIDPNFFLFDADAILLYQNMDVVSQGAMKILSSYATNKQKPHQRQSAQNLKAIKTLDLGRYDGPKEQRLDITKPMEKNAEVKRLHEYWHSNYRTVIDAVLESESDIFIIQDYCTIALTKQIAEALQKKSCKLYFISDIRTNLFDKHGPNDIDIAYNDYLQMACLDILKPEYSMLKFRPPWYAGDRSLDTYLGDLNHYTYITEVFDYMSTVFNLNVVEMMKKKSYMHYANTTILLQPWAPQSSSEARLVISKETILAKRLQDYDPVLWDNAFFFANRFRTYGFTSLGDDDPLYDAGYDSAIEIAILAYYQSQKKNPRPFAEENFKMAFRTRDMVEIRSMCRTIDALLNRDLTSCHRHYKVAAHKYNVYYFASPTGKKYSRWISGPVDIADGKLTENSNLFKDDLKKEYWD